MSDDRPIRTGRVARAGLYEEGLQACRKGLRPVDGVLADGADAMQRLPSAHQAKEKNPRFRQWIPRLRFGP